MPTTIKQLQANSKRLRQDWMMQDFFRFLKNQRTDELLDMQREQLFGDSEGKDGVALGTYYKTYNRRGVTKTKGDPYTMVDTGLLDKKMRVQVLINKMEIVFYNNRKNLDTPHFRFSGIFGTSDWFGLNEENLNVVKGWASEFSKRWAETMITHGERYTG